MDSVPPNFTDAVCRNLPERDLTTLKDFFGRWGLSAKATLRKIVAADVAISCSKDDPSQFNFFLVTYGDTKVPTLNNLRIRRFAIKRYAEDDDNFKCVPLTGGFDGPLFKQLLDIASIDCRNFSLEEIDPNDIDLSRFIPRNLKNLNIYGCNPIEPDSKLLSWLRKVDQFQNLETILIRNTPSEQPIDLSGPMSDLLLNGNMTYLHSTCLVGDSFLKVTDDFLEMASEKWLNHDHKSIRACWVEREAHNVGNGRQYIKTKDNNMVETYGSGYKFTSN
ncbi:hypothetical protein QR680_003548 [Steinernema hermaphroditum]|uniref:Uncharacterized protein n=1 Tax=Steinernema hermaphroditum TaxID=289476 RepID=A0AA39LS59_9BILA|nr:hypothetical protein QR680_003548 [Steinernema hermaphroditum]